MRKPNPYRNEANATKLMPFVYTWTSPTIKNVFLPDLAQHSLVKEEDKCFYMCCNHKEVEAKLRHHWRLPCSLLATRVLDFVETQAYDKATAPEYSCLT